MLNSLPVLPSQVHPSYPYGNPTNIKHPAARPRRTADFSSRALFSDLSYAGGGVNGALRWRDLALERLLPVDHEREEAARAALARKLANGAATANNPSQGQTQAQTADAAPQTTDSEDDSSVDGGGTTDSLERCVNIRSTVQMRHSDALRSTEGDDDDEIENSNMAYEEN